MAIGAAASWSTPAVWSFTLACWLSNAVEGHRSPQRWRDGPAPSELRACFTARASNQTAMSSVGTEEMIFFRAGIHHLS